MVCGWVLWEGRARAQGYSPCQALIRGAVERVHFLCRPVGSSTSWRLRPSCRTGQAQGQGCVYCFILHTCTQQALTNSKKKGGSRLSLERALEPTLPGLTPIISLVAWGRLLKQLNFDRLI